MTDRVPYGLGLKKLDESCPEYWGLVNTLDDEMVEIALSMPQRVPQTLAQIAKSSGWTDTEKLEAKLHEMGCVGLIEWNWENPQHEKQYLLPLFVPGAAEFLNMRKSFVDEHPEVCDFFNKMTRLPIEKITAMVPPGGAGIGMHVIPVEKAIPTESKSVSLEHLSHWLKNTTTTPPACAPAAALRRCAARARAILRTTGASPWATVRATPWRPARTGTRSAMTRSWRSSGAPRRRATSTR